VVDRHRLSAVTPREGLITLGSRSEDPITEPSGIQGMAARRISVLLCSTHIRPPARRLSTRYPLLLTFHDPLHCQSLHLYIF
jgi:hypothetical protein